MDNEDWDENKDPKMEKQKKVESDSGDSDDALDQYQRS